MNTKPPQSARYCPCCGEVHSVAKGQPNPWPKVTRPMIEAAPELVEALTALYRSVMEIQGHWSESVDNRMQQSQAALKKARGEA